MTVSSVFPMEEKRFLYAQPHTPVSRAGDGREGLQAVRESSPNLVLLDLMMPVMDGFEFLKTLRHDLGERALPVIVLTAKELSAAERDILTVASVEGELFSAQVVAI